MAIYFGVLLATCTVMISGCTKDFGPGDKTWHAQVDSHRKKVDVGGYCLNVVDKGEGEPVVMIHGFADSAYSFHKNIQTVLDLGFRVILPEQPGLGKSEAPLEPYIYSVENQAEAILILLDNLGIDRFFVVGHSMGGGIALYLAAHHPKRIKKAMIIDGACYEPKRYRLLTMPGIAWIGKAIAGKWIVRLALYDVFQDNLKVTESMVSEYAQPLKKPEYIPVLAKLLEQYFSKEHDVMSRTYAHLSVPLNVVWGQQDTWIPPEFGRKLAAEVPNASFHLLKDAGHSPHQEQSEKFNSLLYMFLTDCGTAMWGQPFGRF